MFEKLLHTRIIKFLELHEILSNLQFGFIKDVRTKGVIAKVAETEL